MADKHKADHPLGTDGRGRRQQDRTNLPPSEVSQQGGPHQLPSGSTSRLPPYRTVESAQNAPIQEPLPETVSRPGYQTQQPSELGAKRGPPGYYLPEMDRSHFGTGEDRRLPILPIPGQPAVHHPRSYIPPQGQYLAQRDWGASSARQYETSPGQFYPQGQLVPSGVPAAGAPSSSGAQFRDAMDLSGIGDYPPKMPLREPKSRFTPAEDELIKDLKENRTLTWKQIGYFFPGRNHGTLQVRYCTKLKEKEEPEWTDEAMDRLRRFREEDDADRWKRISAKLGGQYSANACQRKAAEMDELDEALRIEKEEDARRAAARGDQ